MAPIADVDLRALLIADPDRGWRVFVDEHTPALIALIERLGVRDRDEAMDLYTRVCERLAENGCERLRRRDPARGALGAWLAVVVRRVAVDWVRSRAGRRRLFAAIRRLDPFHQQVFQLYYWGDRLPAAIAEELSVARGRPIALLDVLAAIDTINGTLTERHYSDLVSMTARSRPQVSLEGELEDGTFDPADPSASASERVEARERQTRLETALAALPPEDAAIVRLHYHQGLALADVRRALHLPELSRSRLDAIVAALKRGLERLDGRTPAPESARGGAS